MLFINNVLNAILNGIVRSLPACIPKPSSNSSLSVNITSTKLLKVSYRVTLICCSVDPLSGEADNDECS